MMQQMRTVWEKADAWWWRTVEAALARLGPRSLARWHVVGRWFRKHGVPLLAGLLGALASVFVMGILRFMLGTATLPELVGQRTLPLLPVSLFLTLLSFFPSNTKTGPLSLALYGQILLGMIIGYLMARRPAVAPASTRWPTRSAWLIAGGVAAAMEIVALILFWPVIIENSYGVPIDRARFVSAVALLLTFAAFAAVTLLAYHGLRRRLPAIAGPIPSNEQSTSTDEADPSPGSAGSLGDRSPAALAAGRPDGTDTPPPTITPSPLTVTRRALIGTAGVGILAVAGSGIAIDAVLQAYLRRSNLAYEGLPTSLAARAAITPNSDFYVVSKNIIDPEVVVANWQLELRGLIHHERTWNYADVVKLPSETRAITMECISNVTGGHLMGTAMWTGVPLQTVLDLGGGPKTTGKYVKFTSNDDYTTSLPLADLLAARALLVWEMNGAPLAPRHGFPLRAIVPGRYGEQSAKWLTRIELLDQPYKGFYQSQGWGSNQVNTTSRIDTPTSNVALGAITVTGIAFAGIRGITQVEVSADNGQTWHPATLMPPLSDQTWTLWQWQWTPVARGTYTLVVRATDGTGAAQIPVHHSIVPDGSAGLERVQVQVR